MWKLIPDTPGRVQFVVFEKLMSACLFQIAREKSCDYVLKRGKPKKCPFF